MKIIFTLYRYCHEMKKIKIFWTYNLNEGNKKYKTEFCGKFCLKVTNRKEDHTGRLGECEVNGNVSGSC